MRKTAEKAPSARNMQVPGVFALFLLSFALVIIRINSQGGLLVPFRKSFEHHYYLCSFPLPEIPAFLLHAHQKHAGLSFPGGKLLPAFLAKFLFHCHVDLSPCFFLVHDYSCIILMPSCPLHTLFWLCLLRLCQLDIEPVACLDRSVSVLSYYHLEIRRMALESCRILLKQRSVNDLGAVVRKYCFIVP